MRNKSHKLNRNFQILSEKVNFSIHWNRVPYLLVSFKNQKKSLKELKTLCLRTRQMNRGGGNIHKSLFDNTINKHTKDKK